MLGNAFKSIKKEVSAVQLISCPFPISWLKNNFRVKTVPKLGWGICPDCKNNRGPATTLQAFLRHLFSPLLPSSRPHPSNRIAWSGQSCHLDRLVPAGSHQGNFPSYDIEGKKRKRDERRTFRDVAGSCSLSSLMQQQQEQKEGAAGFPWRRGTRTTWSWGTAD